MSAKSFASKVHKFEGDCNKGRFRNFGIASYFGFGRQSIYRQQLTGLVSKFIEMLS